MGEDDAWLEKVLSVPPVLVYAGHMIDQPDREDPRFPASLESAVGKQIRSKLERIKPVAAYGSAACGADILCLEAIRDLGGEIHITLPFPPDEFREFCVDFVPNARWGERFESLLEAADSLIVASDHRAEGSVSTFEYANLIMTGMCWLRSEVLETSLVGLAVWDGGPNGGVGGTTSVVDLWRSRGIRKEIISITDLRRSQLGETADSPDGTLSKTKPITASTRFPHEIKAMLFADAVGYSKLTENQIPNFIECFLGAVAELNDRSAHPPIHMETAGDGLYFVFTDTADAGHYALELSELVATIDWQEHGLPSTFDMRIGLHCGPVFCTQDPITKLPLYTGPHTSRTARIEPITPPGQVYASSAFAAVAAATGVDGLKFSYIGRTQLAKKYGSLALYHVQRP
jgi:class 3 adenylate cyclase